MNHVVGRFAQYRKIAQDKIAELEEVTETTIAKTTRKVKDQLATNISEN